MFIYAEMVTDILVSVIVPVYNVAPYLKEAIESVICQSFPYLEIIIVNDGSSDKSKDICEQYALRDKRIKLINQDNSGLSAARNAGLDAATGDFIAFLDSDDAYHPDFVKTLVNAILSHDADLAMCKCRTYRTEATMESDGYRGKTVPSILPGSYDRENSLRALLGGAINPGVWNKLYKKSLWESVRFPDGHVYEEVRTIYQILDLSESVYICGDLLYLHRKRRGSITETCSQKNVSDWFLAYSYFDDYVLKNIPAVFSSEMLEDSRRQRMHTMIRFYGLYSGEKKYKKYLRCKILESIDELGISNERFITRIGLYMVLCCPWLLRLTYRVYYSIREVIPASLRRDMSRITCVERHGYEQKEDN